jgi:hypothetical protein
MLKSERLRRQHHAAREKYLQTQAGPKYKERRRWYRIMARLAAEYREAKRQERAA